LWYSDNIHSQIETIEFGFENVTESPSIRLHTSYDGVFPVDDEQWSANDHALSETSINSFLSDAHAGNHVDTNAYREVSAEGAPAILHKSDLDPAIVAAWGAFVLDSGYIFIPLMFEALTEGQGDLVVTFKNAQGEDLGSSRVSLDLRDVQAFYEHWSVGNDTETNYADIPFEANLISPTRPTAQFTWDDFTDDYFVFTHGWNTELDERLSFAETTYKRMWWNGYEGQFGLYSWPTDTINDAPTNGIVGFAIGAASNLTDLDNFNRSERRAYESAEGLRDLLSDLQSDRYFGNVSLLAHSMGGVVASEALRREVVLASQPEELVQNVILTQVAMSADAYDSVAADMDDWNVFGISDAGVPDHPNLYATYPDGNGTLYSQIGGAAENIYNYYNEDDYALGVWKSNQNAKHGGGIVGFDTGYTYAYIDGKTFNTPTGLQALEEDITSSYELLAYAVRSYSEAVGAVEIDGSIVTSVNIKDLFTIAGAAHDHSGQFNRSLVDNDEYWDELIKNIGGLA